MKQIIILLFCIKLYNNRYKRKLKFHYFSQTFKIIQIIQIYTNLHKSTANNNYKNINNSL